MLAILEFFLINWLGRHSISSGYYQITFVQNYEDAPLFNLFFRVLAPTVFLVLCTSVAYAAGLDDLTSSIWRVTLLYFGIRWGYNLLMGRGALLIWPNQIGFAVIATGLSYVVYRKFLTDRAAVLPSARALVDELWVVVIIFLYHTYRQVSPFGARDKLRKRRKIYVQSQYTKFRRRFHDRIAGNAESVFVELLAYSVMIYESFNRPPTHQWIERHVMFRLGLARSLGPMQVRTAEALSDEELVATAVRKLARDYASCMREEIAIDPKGASVVARRSGAEGVELPFDPAQDLSKLTGNDLGYWKLRKVLKCALQRYNIRSDYPDQVLGIYDELQPTFYPQLAQG